ncbi:MAG: DMT family transporter [Proteobacteria bacterium]|nr:DMT family transporter [Desulfobacula sp.]MBU3950880.1 DMT family transporter [Pseudomonadota bacterium]MBU4130342.1 DMT family transporter [Pseudomonadota bacterium]
MAPKIHLHSIAAGYLFALGATAIWSGNFIVARGLNDQIPPVSLAFFRWVTAVAVFAPFAVKGVVKELPIIRQHLVYLAITSFIGITCFNTFIYVAGHTTTAMNMSLIAITFPIFILIFSRVLFKESVSIKKGMGIFLVLTGVVFLITKGNVSALVNISFVIGDLWMLAASVLFAVYSLLLKHKPGGICVNTLQFTCFAMGLVFLLPFFVWEQSWVQGNLLNHTTIPAILYVGIFASLCAFVLWTQAIVTLGPAKAGMVYYSLPLFSGFLAYLFLNEAIGKIHFFCLVLILSGIVITNHEARPVAPKEKGQVSQ